MVVINPKQEYVETELAKMLWFLSHMNLTVDPDAADHIQEAHNEIYKLLQILRRFPKKKVPKKK